MGYSNTSKYMDGNMYEGEWNLNEKGSTLQGNLVMHQQNSYPDAGAMKGKYSKQTAHLNLNDVNFEIFYYSVGKSVIDRCVD